MPAARNRRFSSSAPFSASNTIAFPSVQEIPATVPPRCTPWASASVSQLLPSPPRPAIVVR